MDSPQENPGNIINYKHETTTKLQTTPPKDGHVELIFHKSSMLNGDA